MSRTVIVVADKVLYEEKGLLRAARDLGLQTAVRALGDLAVRCGDGWGADNTGAETPLYFIRCGGYHDGIAASTMIETAGGNTVNSSSVLDMCGRKHITDAWLRRHGFLVPRSGQVLRPDSAAAVGRALGFPLVVKPPIGGFGTGVHLVRDVDHLASLAEYVFRSAPAHNRHLYVQEHIDAAAEYRVLVANAAVLGGMERTIHASPGPFIARNVGRGGTGHSTTLPEGVLRTSERLGSLLPASYLGVDLFRRHDGSVLICEINAVPRYRELDRVLDGAVARGIVGALAGSAEKKLCLS